MKHDAERLPRALLNGFKNSTACARLCYLFFGIAFFASFYACKPEAENAQSIVDACIAAHGGQHYDNFKVNLQFRDALYTLERSHGHFEYSRSLSDTLGNFFEDYLNNDGFFRLKNGDTLQLDDRMYSALSNSVNSVAYFALLPQPLNDPAVHKKWLGEREINGEPLFLIQVTFAEEGGGKDHDDIYYYWINQKTGLIDFLAYEYHINQGGVRFREAYNQREVAGIIWQDYRNYKPAGQISSPDELMAQFLADEMELVSDIKLENVY